MVQETVRTSSGAANDYRKQTFVTPRYKLKTSSLSQTETARRDVHWRSAQTSTVQKETINVHNKGCRDGTKNRYKYIFRRWKKFCGERNYNTMKINTNIVLEFLPLEYNRVLPYNVIRSVLSAISSYLPHKVGHRNIIKKFMKGAFNLRSPKTPYHAVWDVSILLNYFQNMNTDSDMNKSKMIVCLMMLLLGTRVNKLTHLKVTNLYITDTECTFVFDEVLKHYRPKYCQKPLLFKAHPKCQELCPVKNLLRHSDIRLTRSSDPALFISTTKPFKPVSKDTTARWIKNTMKEANIDTGLFTVHICRSASTSKAKIAGLNIKTILNSANWIKDNIFKRYYFKIQKNYQTDHSNFDMELLDNIIRY